MAAGHLGDGFEAGYSNSNVHYFFIHPVCGEAARQGRSHLFINLAGFSVDVSPAYDLLVMVLEQVPVEPLDQPDTSLIGHIAPPSALVGPL